MNFESNAGSRSKRVLAVSLLSAAVLLPQLASAQMDGPLMDFGDAPDYDVKMLEGNSSAQVEPFAWVNYPTVLASDGARHIMGSLRLGTCIDAEPDGQPSVDADGDDLSSGPSDCGFIGLGMARPFCAVTNDEDGIWFNPNDNENVTANLVNGMPTVVAGSTFNFRAFVNGADPKRGARLTAFFDFKREGWAANHDALLGLKVVNGENDFTVRVPADALAGPAYARFRLASTRVGLPTGLAKDGEVEDYAFVVLAQPGLTASGVDQGGFGFLTATLSIPASSLPPRPSNAAQAQPQGITSPYITFWSKNGGYLCEAQLSGSDSNGRTLTSTASCSTNNWDLLPAISGMGMSPYQDALANGFVARFDGFEPAYLAPASATGRIAQRRAPRPRR